jgi:hypothetical protein
VIFMKKKKIAIQKFREKEEYIFVCTFNKYIVQLCILHLQDYQIHAAGESSYYTLSSKRSSNTVSRIEKTAIFLIFYCSTYKDWLWTRHMTDTLFIVLSVACWIIYGVQKKKLVAVCVQIIHFARILFRLNYRIFRLGKYFYHIKTRVSFR